MLRNQQLFCHLLRGRKSQVRPIVVTFSYQVLFLKYMSLRRSTLLRVDEEASEYAVIQVLVRWRLKERSPWEKGAAKSEFVICLLLLLSP